MRLLKALLALFPAGQLYLRSETRFYANGTIVAGSKSNATGLMVITYGQVGAAPTRARERPRRRPRPSRRGRATLRRP